MLIQNCVAPRLDQTTPLIIAAYFGNITELKLLLGCKNINTRATFNARTAIEWAKYANNTEAVRLLEEFERNQLSWSC